MRKKSPTSHEVESAIAKLFGVESAAPAIPKKKVARRSANRRDELARQQIDRLPDGSIVATFWIRLENESNKRGDLAKGRRAREVNLTIIGELGKRFGWPAVLLKDFPIALSVATRAKNRKRLPNPAFDLRRLARAPGWRAHGIVGPLNVTLTRIAPRLFAENESDSLSSALKSTQDAVARWLGVDDSDSIVSYAREQSRDDAYGVKIQIRRRS